METAGHVALELCLGYISRFTWISVARVMELEKQLVFSRPWHTLCGFDKLAFDWQCQLAFRASRLQPRRINNLVDASMQVALVLVTATFQVTEHAPYQVINVRVSL
jgi:hypothetical protein